MYAYFPSSDATISCGSSPAGTRPTTFNVPGSTIAIDLSFFSSTSKAGDGIWASRELPTKNRRHPSDDAHTFLNISSPRNKYQGMRRSTEWYRRSTGLHLGRNASIQIFGSETLTALLEMVAGPIPPEIVDGIKYRNIEPQSGQRTIQQRLIPGGK